MEATSPRDKALFDVILSWLNERGWKFQQSEDRLLVQFGIAGKHGTWYCFGTVEREVVVFLSTLVPKIPEENRRVVAELLCRANYGLLIGSFEMDFADGEMRYRTSVDMEGGELTEVMVGNLLKANVGTVDRFLPGVTSLLEDGLSAEQAIGRVEEL